MTVKRCTCQIDHVGKDADGQRQLHSESNDQRLSLAAASLAHTTGDTRSATTCRHTDRRRLWMHCVAMHLFSRKIEPMRRQSKNKTPVLLVSTTSIDFQHSFTARLDMSSRRSGICKDHFVEIFVESIAVKEFWKYFAKLSIRLWCLVFFGSRCIYIVAQKVGQYILLKPFIRLWFLHQT